MDLNLPLRLSGAIWGHLVGDALGVPYEFRPPAAIGEVRFGASGTIHRQPPGTWSDDGALMLALLDSLLEAGFDPEDQGHRVVAWFAKGAYTPDGDGRFDVGNTTSQAITALRRGTPAATAGPTDERSCGNGSLMRILPLALVDGLTVSRKRAPEELVERAHRASRVTHGHPRCQVACALYVLVASELLKGSADRKAALTHARLTLRAIYQASASNGRPNGEEEGDGDAETYLAALDHLEGWTGRKGEGVVWDSFWSAWDAFAGAESYRETIERAVACGNDTDTTAAIAGGLAGIHWGLDDIPAAWLAGMRGRSIVEEMIERLFVHHGWKTSTSHPVVVGLP